MKNFTDLEIYKKIKDKRLKASIDFIINNITPIQNSINALFPNFTMHDMDHCYRVASLMEKLTDGKSFNDFEYALMILTSYLHDIGMSYSNDDRVNIIKGHEDSNDISFQGILRVVNDEDCAIKDFIRRTHHKRVEKFLNKEFDKTSLGAHLYLDHIDYSKQIIDLCQAHGEDFSFILKLSRDFCIGEYKTNLRFMAALLRLADLIEIDIQRTPPIMYIINNPQGFSEIEWEKHFSISGYEHIRNYKDKMQICFHGKCSNPIVYRNYLNYISYIESEINSIDDKLNNEGDEKYSLPLYKYVYNNVEASGFSFVDLKLNLDYSKITNLLMGEHIYKNKKVGLRELLQNSIDSCNLMKEKALNYYQDNFINYQPQIKIEFSQKNNYIKIIDNGTGMNLNIIKKYFLNVGMSYYQSNDYKYENNKYSAIGKFGIGFLSCFLLSNDVNVTTRHFQSPSKTYKIDLKKDSEFVVISDIDSNYSVNHFTEIRLNYMDFSNVFSGGIEDVQSYIIKNIYSDINIVVEDADSRNNLSCICNKTINKNTIISDSFQAINGYNYLKDIHQISCENYSKILNGDIIFNISTKYHAIKLNDDNLYIYDIKNQTMSPIKLDNVPNGEYYIFFNLTRVFNSTNESVVDKNKLGILSQNDLCEKSLFAKLLFPTSVKISEMKSIFYINGNRLDRLLPKISINDETTIINSKSTLNYGFKVIYKYNNIILPFSGISTSNYLINLHYSEEFKKEITPLSLYYKQIYVCELDYNFNSPFDIKILDSHINCNLDKSISLNISRDSILHGESLYKNEIDKILFLTLRDINNNKDKIIDDFIEIKLKQLDEIENY